VCLTSKKRKKKRQRQCRGRLRDLKYEKTTRHIEPKISPNELKPMLGEEEKKSWPFEQPRREDAEEKKKK